MASEDLHQIGNPGHVAFSEPESEKFFAKDFHAKFTSRLVTLRESEILTDVTLKCKNVMLTCHKVVLAAASSYFHAMFCAGFKESKQDVVVLETFDPNILPIIINFIYTAEATLSTDNVQSICSACDELELVELKKGCDTFMSQRVEPANCLGLYMFSKKFDLRITLKKCKECMQKGLNGILCLALDQELKVLGEDELVEYISNDDLIVEDEVMVFKLVERWVSVDPDNRMKTVDRLMKHVRLAYCSPSKLGFEIKQSPIMQSMKCAHLVIDAFNYQLVPDAKQLLGGGIHKPRQFRQQLLLLDGNKSAQGKCWFLDPKAEQWKEFTNLPMDELFYFKVCVSNYDIIITGGYRNSQHTNTAWAFCLYTNKWRALPTMKYAREHHAMVSIEDEVYVLGGNRGNYGTDEVEKLDASRQGWTQMDPMKKKVYYHVAVNIDKIIYVIGGKDQSGNSSMVTQMYDVTTDQWETKANIPQACKYGAAVVLNKKIYVVGDGTRCCLSYDPAQDTWTIHTRPQQERNDPAAVAWKGKIVLFGGSGNKDVEEYDHEKDQWSTWQMTLPKGMSYHSIVVAHGSFK